MTSIKVEEEPISINNEVKTEVSIKKPKSARGKAFLKKREPKEVEYIKQLLLVMETTANKKIKGVFLDFDKMKYNECTRIGKQKFHFKPFEGGNEMALEVLAKRHDCGLFIIGSSTKKRPRNLVFGRMYNAKIFDMVEMEMNNHIPISSFKKVKHTFSLGMKPCFAFYGEHFETSPGLNLFKNMLIDIFRGQLVNEIPIGGLKRLIFVLAKSDTEVIMKQFAVHTDSKKEVELTETGPSLILTLRRVREAPEDIKKEAFKKAPIKKKHKNVERDELGSKVGHFYVPTQDIDSIIHARYKGSKRSKKSNKLNEQEAGEGMESEIP